MISGRFIVRSLSFVAAVGGLALSVSVSSGGAARNIRVSEELPATAMDRDLSPASNSPLLVEDPGNSRFVVMANRLDAPDFGCALQVSGDRGRTWIPAAPVPTLPEGAEKCYAPEVAFDRRGILYYLFVGLTGRGNRPMGVFLTSSADRGRTFSKPHRVLGPNNFSVRMAIDASRGSAGRMHLVWIKPGAEPAFGGFAAAPNPIVAAHSDDGGRRFSRPSRVSDPSRPRAVAPTLTLGPEGEPLVAYYDLKDDAVDYQGLEGGVWEESWAVVFSKSNDGGRTFMKGIEAESSLKPFERVMLIFTMPPPSITAGRKLACLAWPDGRMGDPDVFVRCSKDGGLSWSPRKRINDDKPRNGLYQYLPRLGMAPEGRLDVIFLDRRLDPKNLFYNVFYSHSDDGGREFSKNVRVTRDSSLSKLGQQYGNVSAEGLVEFGSRLGLVSREESALTAWTDNRNSKPFSTGQDIFTAFVVPPKDSIAASSYRNLGYGILAGGILGLLTTFRRGRVGAAAPQRAGSSTTAGKS